MIFAGIDGCKCGWVAVALDGEAVRWLVADSFSEAISLLGDDCSIFVDMPIGLPATGSRVADGEARNALPSHLKSSIFNIPVRKAVYAETKAEAKSINKKLSGKSLSEQSLGLVSKIRDVDVFFQQHAERHQSIFESHPEICFGHLGEGYPSYAKKDLLGGLERLKILEKYIPSIENVLVEIRKKYPRTKVAADDVLDAAILAAANRKCMGRPRCFPLGNDTPPRDETGLPMAIWYP